MNNRLNRARKCLYSRAPRQLVPVRRARAGPRSETAVASVPPHVADSGTEYPRSPAPRPRDPMTLVYQRSGSGPPLVLIHGTGGYWRTWLPVIDRLAERREVFA